MARLTLSQVLAFTGGHLHEASGCSAERTGLNEPEFVFQDVSTDTRTVGQGDLFLALRGAKFDGHEFLAQALTQGAAGLVIDEQAPLPDQIQILASAPVIVVVPDTLTALQDLAAGYRRTLSAPVIAITGSVGKTSTRGMVAACLKPTLQVCQTTANNNNEIGLPKTILAATLTDQVIVLEMGMRGRGEIELLSKIAQPDIALITNIGVAHIERLGSQEEIFQAKAEIIAGLAPGARVVLNADDPFLEKFARDICHHYQVSLVSTEQPGDPAELAGMTLFWADQLDLTGQQTTYLLKTWPERAAALQLPVLLPVPGRHMVSNSLFGLAVADCLGVDLASAAAGAAQFENTGNRQRLLKAGPILVMDDSYNASPESMLAALSTLQAISEGRRLVAALGGMLELGNYAAKGHFDVGAAAARHGFAEVLALGPHATDVEAGFASGKTQGSCTGFLDQTALIQHLLATLQPDDLLLVKGSRGFAMEQVTQAVYDFWSRSETGSTHDLHSDNHQGGFRS